MYDWAVDHAAILIGVAFGLAGLQVSCHALLVVKGICDIIVTNHK